MNARNLEIIKPNSDSSLESLKKQNVMDEHQNDILEDSDSPKKGGIPEEPEEVILSPEEVKMKRIKINEIKNWLTHPRIGKHLDEFKSINLEEMEYEKLNLLLEEIHAHVSVKNNQSGVEHAFKASTLLIEGLTNRYTQYDLTGYGNYMNTDDKVLDTIAEVSLHYQNLSIVSPEKRLIYLMITGAIAMNTINSQKKSINKIENELKKPVSETIMRNYNDL